VHSRHRKKLNSPRRQTSHRVSPPSRTRPQTKHSCPSRLQSLPQSHVSPALFSPELLIKDLGNSHRLLFNKFNIYDNHLLVVTREFESQKEPISQGDMVYAGLVCEALQGILFFNGGVLSGASQPHKHLQILPSKAKELPIFADVLQWTKSLPQ
jgi:ATP adenylyltransferase/5',5'''-P-1,P-4-tetraphosphate phosphorylase II